MKDFQVLATLLFISVFQVCQIYQVSLLIFKPNISSYFRYCISAADNFWSLPWISVILLANTHPITRARQKNELHSSAIGQLSINFIMYLRWLDTFGSWNVKEQYVGRVYYSAAHVHCWISIENPIGPLQQTPGCWVINHIRRIWPKPNGVPIVVWGTCMVINVCFRSRLNCICWLLSWLVITEKFKTISLF